jgi:hypothetical protein
VDLGYRLIRNGVKVIRDYSIANYHLVHQADPEKRESEYWRNFDRFIGKIKEDKLTVFMAKLVNTFSPFN